MNVVGASGARPKGDFIMKKTIKLNSTILESQELFHASGVQNKYYSVNITNYSDTFINFECSNGNELKLGTELKELVIMKADNDSLVDETVCKIWSLPVVFEGKYCKTDSNTSKIDGYSYNFFGKEKPYSNVSITMNESFEDFLSLGELYYIGLN